MISTIAVDNKAWGNVIAELCEECVVGKFDWPCTLCESSKTSFTKLETFLCVVVPSYSRCNKLMCFLWQYRQVFDSQADVKCPDLNQFVHNFNFFISSKHKLIGTFNKILDL